MRLTKKVVDEINTKLNALTFETYFTNLPVVDIKRILNNFFIEPDRLYLCFGHNGKVEVKIFFTNNETGDILKVTNGMLNIQWTKLNWSGSKYYYQIGLFIG